MDAPNQEQTQTAGETEGAAKPISIDVTPEILTALGVPADNVTPEAVLAAIAAFAESTKSAGAQIAALTAERDAAAAKLREIEEAKTMAEVDALLEDYELPEAALPAMRDLAKTNRAQAEALLGAVPKKAAPKGDAPAQQTEIPPPAPIHDPASQQQQPQTAGERAAEAEKLIKAVQAEGKFKDYTSAREEARRRQPGLFA